MKTDERFNSGPSQSQDVGVQHDSETPMPKKPSLLFIISTLSIVITFIIVMAMTYNGLFH